jgi:tetratricopeptide (TPR) repeat protein
MFVRDAIALCSLVLVSQAVASCESSEFQVHEIAAPFERPASVIVPAGAVGIVLEETGTDLEFRVGGDTEFRDILVRPPRVGLVGLPGSIRSVEIRSKPNQAPGKVRVRPLCTDTGEIPFLERIASSFRDGIDAGKGGEVLAALEQWQGEESIPVRKAWLLQLRSNALESIGKDLDASAAYLAARAAWLGVGDHARAAVDLMASAEDLSRAGEHDQAMEMFDAVLPELEQSGLNYYRLRTESSKCLIQSRRGDVAGALECDIPIVADMRSSGELSEATRREVSIANQWLKLGKTENARAALLRADSHADSLSKYGIPRLSAAFGNYYLQTGDITSAAREYTLASRRFEVASLPQDQADIDLKLSRLAHVAGAYTEELRLIDRAIAHLDPKSAREQIADARYRSAEANISIGDLEEANKDLTEAHHLCEALDRVDCLDQIELRRVRNALLLGDAAHARMLLLPVQDRIAEGHPILRYLALEDPKFSPERLRARLFELSVASPPGDPDLTVDLALASARLLDVRSQGDAAADLLRTTLIRLTAGVRSWPSIALRIGARARLGRLQQAWFDRLPATAGAVLRPDQLDRLFEVVDANGAESLLVRGGAANELPAALRERLSKGILSGTPVDQRELFLSLSGVENARDEDIAEPRLSDTSTYADSHGHLVILPLLGAQRFVLVVSDGEVSRICESTTASEYRAQVARFEDALDGADVDIIQLDRRARFWRESVEHCSSDLSFSGDWWIVSTPGTPQLPWSWIAAAAVEPAAIEPLVTIGFSWPSAPTKPIELASAVEVIDLNLTGTDRLAHADAEKEAMVRVFKAVDGGPTLHFSADIAGVEGVLESLTSDGAWTHVIGHGNDVAYGQLYSGIWLPGAGEPQLLTLPELMARPSGAALVVLSACGTIVPGQTQGSARLGLSEALVASGVRHAVALSNKASDAAARRWVTTLYAALLKNQSPASAAREARQALRTNIAFRHPKYWAGLDFYSGGEPSSAMNFTDLTHPEGGSNGR